MFEKHKGIELIVPCSSYGDLCRVLSLPVQAIYIGITGWSRANRGAEFNIKEIPEAVEKAHSLGKRVYLSFNLMPSPFETTMALKTLLKCMDCGIDAVIASEPSIISTLAHEGYEVHASLGTASINVEDIKFYKELGAKRVVTSPNLTPSEVLEIKRETETQGIELEVMVWGIKCITTYLGICRLSSFFDMIITNAGIRALIWEGSAKRSGVCFRPCAQEWFTETESFYSLAPYTNFELYSALELIKGGIKNIKIGGRGMPFPFLKRIVDTIVEELEVKNEQ
ncbi:peptidase U32 [Thermosulfidibacter takaii ABI70S6]|uniref:Peptidase U32 n=1 Tax=Thermosulfidibacter takaii (strain DSM 17441 / JCM 13301 / NBRC 103674 / ABI70S6) TaxID=1298851 RepID=A0A0S3QUB1_THET7|nr:U32 family peptidase [Thermosulfidibacter takaii]BAT71919.1 peptidase U32 [Thermosulfidibacter takaii ABI70S6]